MSRYLGAYNTMLYEGGCVTEQVERRRDCVYGVQMRMGAPKLPGIRKATSSCKQERGSNALRAGKHVYRCRQVPTSEPWVLLQVYYRGGYYYDFYDYFKFFALWTCEKQQSVDRQLRRPDEPQEL